MGLKALLQEARALLEEPKLGSGKRFSRLSNKLAHQGVRDPDALAAAIGRKKYGKARFQKLSHHEGVMDEGEDCGCGSSCNCGSCQDKQGGEGRKQLLDVALKERIKKRRGYYQAMRGKYHK